MVNIRAVAAAVKSIVQAAFVPVFPADIFKSGLVKNLAFTIGVEQAAENFTDGFNHMAAADLGAAGH